MGGRPQGVARLREREPRVPDEVLELARPRPRFPYEEPLGTVETENGEVVAKERAVPAVEDQIDVAEIRADVGGLRLPVESVDERLHLLVDSRGDDPPGR